MRTCRIPMKIQNALELHPDYGKSVDGILIRELSKILGVRKTRTAPHYLHGSKYQEGNAVIKSMLAAYVNENLNNWDIYFRFITLKGS